jgi:3-methylfumaryl-CoA hydratase
MSDAIREQELLLYREWIGRKTIVEDHISPDVIRRFAAAVDRDMPKEHVPPMWHYGLFLNSEPTANLGPDGHPPRGGALPPVRLPRRMFAGSEMKFLGPLKIGVAGACESEVVSVDLRQGKAGDLVIIRVADRIVQGGQLCIEETRTIVYLGAGTPVPPVVAGDRQPAPGEERWLPNSTALFRFSAVTYNAHRIHYDEPYAREAEGYPGLVVHGPFTALKLCDFAARRLKRPLTSFSFRGEAPLFCGQPVTLAAAQEGGTLRVTARRCDGVTAMQAQAS